MNFIFFRMTFLVLRFSSMKIFQSLTIVFCIIKFFIQCQVNFLFYLFLDYIDYGSLSDYMISYHKVLTDEETCWVLDSVLKGLNYLHSQGILHLNLKAENVLISTDHRVLLTDISLLHNVIYYIPKVKPEEGKKKKEKVKDKVNEQIPIFSSSNSLGYIGYSYGVPPGLV